MGGKWLASLIIHKLLRIAVVCADKQNSVGFFNRFYSSPHTCIHGLDRLDCGALHACVAYHIRICEVNDDHIVFSRTNSLYQLIAHLRRAHLRLKVVSGNLRRFDKDPVLSLVRFFYASVKEKGNVGVFSVSAILACFKP